MLTGVAMKQDNPLHADNVLALDKLPNAKEEPSATIESINCALQAYATLPFVSTLILAFVTAQNPPCQACEHQNIIDATSIVNAVCMACALCSICTTLLIIYQASKLISAKGPQAASVYLRKTSLYREISRNSTYLALFTFVLGFGICLAGSSSNGVAAAVSVVLILGVIGVIYIYHTMRGVFSVINKEGK